MNPLTKEFGKYLNKKEKMIVPIKEKLISKPKTMSATKQQSASGEKKKQQAPVGKPGKPGTPNVVPPWEQDDTTLGREPNLPSA